MDGMSFLPIFTARHSHERYGFSNEVKVKYEDKLMELFSETFRALVILGGADRNNFS